MDATYSAEEHFRQGRELLGAGGESDALEHLRAAHELDRDNARFASYYGLALALVERRFNRAVELCRAAVKHEFFSPDLYHNLARVHLAFGFKAEGMRFLRRGLMIDPANQAILAELVGLGMRRHPVLPFLPRGHLLNRLLGRLRSQVEPEGLRASA